MDCTERARRRRHLLFAGAGALSGVAVFYILARHGIGIPCVFNRITGLLCPGCGNSRAALAFMRFQFRKAFSYNPMFLPEFLYILKVLFFCSSSYLKGGSFSYKPRRQWPDILLLAAVIIWGVLRNFL